MLRKSLILGSMTLLLVMLFAFTGCEGPVGPEGVGGPDGDPGRLGDPGSPSYNGIGGQKVTPAELEVAFMRGDPVVVETSVEFISGTVPSGKTLVILGDSAVAEAGLLKVEGALRLKDETSMLWALGISGSSPSGVLAVEGDGKLEGPGTFMLPYIVNEKGGEKFTGLHFNSPIVVDSGVTRYPGSIINNINGEPSVLDSNAIKSIFALPSVDTLTVVNVPNLAVDVIPQGKALILKGKGNTTAGSLRVSERATLTIDKDAVLAVAAAGTIATSGAESVINNNGTIKLDSSAKAGNGDPAAKFFNNGTIEWPDDGTGSVGVLEDLLSLQGEGIILINPELNGPVARTQIKLVSPSQDLILAPSGAKYVLELKNNSFPFNTVQDKEDPAYVRSGKTLTLANENAGLVLPPNVKDVDLSVINRGEITTETKESDGLTVIKDLFDRLESGGKVVASGELPVLVDSFEIPAGVELVIQHMDTILAAAATVGITVNGTLTVGVEGSYNYPSINLGDGFLTVADKGILRIVGDSELRTAGDINIAGILDLGNDNGVVEVTGMGTFTLFSDNVLTVSGGEEVSGRIVATQDRLVIDGIEGYKIPSGGVMGANLKSAVNDIFRASEILEEKEFVLEASSEYYAGNPPTGGLLSVIGTVDITADAARNGVNFVNNISSANLDANTYVYFPLGVSFESGSVEGKPGGVVDGNLNPVEKNNYRLSVGGDSRLSVKHDQFLSGDKDGWGILQFEGRLTKAGLVGPVYPATTSGPGPWVKPFNIGIHSKVVVN